MSARNLRTVALLGTTQTLAWASSYYLPAILAKPIAHELGVSVPTVFAAFSLALIVSALMGPLSGRAIDRWGGRPVLATTNIVFALGLATMSVANGPLGLFAAWIVLGIAMGSGLYEAAFSALVHLYGADSRKAITGITLMAGFASTLGWPLTTLLEFEFGWRAACLAWAGFHLLIGLPLNALLPRTSHLTPSTPARSEQEEATVNEGEQSGRVVPLLAFVFAAVWFVSTAMAAHLPGVLQAAGASVTVAVAAGALLGPAQVGARMLEYGLLRRWHPLISARIATLMHPIGAAVLAFFGAPAAAVFTVMHGAGNGVLTIANGTLPLALFGPRGYGARQGLLMIPARVVQASAPWVFGLCIEHWGANALWLTASTILAAFVALLLLPRTARIPSRQSESRSSESD